MIKKIYLSSIFSFAVAGLLAQETPNLNQEIVTVGERELKLKDAFKANFYPTEVDTVIKKENLTYDFLPGFVKTSFNPDTIQAAKLKVVEPLSKLYPGYVKLGFGNYTMPYAEAYYGSNRNRNGMFAVKLSHISSKGNEADVDKFAGPFSKSTGAFWVKRFLKSSAFSAKVYGGYEGRTLAVNPEADDVNPAPITLVPERNFLNAGTQIAFQSYKKDQDALNHHEKLDFDFFADNSTAADGFTATEINVSASTRLEKYYNKEIYKVDFGVEQNLYSQKDSAYKQSNTLINLAPTISTRTDLVQVDLGLGIFSFFDNGRSYFYFVPKASAAYTGFEKYAVPYAGLDGDAQINRFADLMNQNPFYGPVEDLRLKRENLHVYLGIRGRISDKSSYNLKVYRSRKIDQSIYLPNAGTIRSFEVAYQSYNHFGALAEYSLAFAKRFEGNVAFQYHKYSIDQLLNLPEYEINTELKYNLGDKLLLKTGAHIVPQRLNTTTLDEDGDRIQSNLGSIVDVNFGAEYRYTRRLAAFINFSNISNNRYLLYPNYAVLGFNVMGGLNYSF